LRNYNPNYQLNVDLYDITGKHQLESIAYEKLISEWITEDGNLASDAFNNDIQSMVSSLGGK
jgi:hypothetical protein